MKDILNLTQHPSTREQREQGVFDLEEENLTKLKELLTFENLPSLQKIQERAGEIALLASSYSPSRAMIGGAPYLMSALERALYAAGIKPIYAFSKRESVERIIGGKVVKTNIFRHIGFVFV